ncbi:hypothetical protein [Ideonella sp.]|uniref:hypothetical protein n=1 Tax=Ideonella sp. TaxID=1929293 RepID=UPI0035B434A6
MASLPDNLVGLLRQINGFILFGGGLHVRGVCEEPEWHSIASVIAGPTALHKLYPSLQPGDVPFAQDCVADQYVLRDRKVHKLEAETGHLVALGLSLPEFFAAVQSSPIEFLTMQPLLRHQQDGGSLEPGQVLHVYPPFCTKEAANGVSLKPVPVQEAIAFLADFSSQISSLAPGQKFSVKVVP